MGGCEVAGLSCSARFARLTGQVFRTVRAGHCINPMSRGVWDVPTMREGLVVLARESGKRRADPLMHGLIVGPEY